MQRYLTLSEIAKSEIHEDIEEIVVNHFGMEDAEIKRVHPEHDGDTVGATGIRIETEQGLIGSDIVYDVCWATSDLEQRVYTEVAHLWRRVNHV